MSIKTILHGAEIVPLCTSSLLPPLLSIIPPLLKLSLYHRGPMVNKVLHVDCNLATKDHKFSGNCREVFRKCEARQHISIH